MLGQGEQSTAFDNFGYIDHRELSDLRQKDKKQQEGAGERTTVNYIEAQMPYEITVIMTLVNMIGNQFLLINKK